MIDFINEFFTSTYYYNKFFYIIRLLSVMSLAGIGLGLAGRLMSSGFKKNKLKLPGVG